MGAGGLNWNTIYYSVHSHTVIALEAYSYLGKSNICLSCNIHVQSYLSQLVINEQLLYGSVTRIVTCKTALKYQQDKLSF